MRRLREGGRGWRGLEPSCDTFKTCNVVNKHANQRYFQEAEDLRWGSWCFEQIFEQGMFSSSDVVYDVSISWNYILLCLNDNFRLKKNGAKIERNDGKQLRAKTWPVDWRVYTWEQWVCKTIGQNRTSTISSLEVARYDCLLHRFSLTSQPPLISVEN